MARSFSTRDAKRLLSDVTELQARVGAVGAKVDELRRPIAQAANELKRDRLTQALLEIPVEDLNKKKKGLRTSLLRENGYASVAHVCLASVDNLSSIYGISESAARDMKNAAAEYAGQIQAGVRVRLSADDRDRSTTALVHGVAVYRHALFLAGEIVRESSAVSNLIEYAQTDLSSAVGLRWLLCSSEKKASAEKAYNYLREVYLGSYGSLQRLSLRKLDEADRMAADEAWHAFESDPVGFSNVIEKAAPGFLDSGVTVGYGLPEDLALQIKDECLYPDGLLVELRGYQEWGVKYALHQGKVLLGDEMGLGKTIQAIATMVSLKNVGATHFIVVCPASVVANWCREVATKSRLRVEKIHGSTRDRAFASWRKSGGVAVTTFETTEYLNLEEAFRFSLLVVDEAHYVKNPGARRSSNVAKLSCHADRLLFMTGTALENKVDEMVELIRLLRPDIAQSISGMTHISSSPQFKEAIAPVYYRRRREDVLSELPELIESEDWCSMSAVEEWAYEEVVLAKGKNMMAARRVSWNVDDLSESSKAQRLQEIVQESKEDGRKVLVFSFFLDTIEKAMELVGEKCCGPINGSVPPNRRQEIIDEFEKAPAGTVLVSQIQSGGTGMNIQAASVVVICEPQFKPSTENQAISRAYRMGQSRNVLVHRLLCLDSVDERIMEILAEKQRLFDAFADESVAAKESLCVDEKAYGNIIKKEIERIKAKRGDSGNAGSEERPSSALGAEKPTLDADCCPEVCKPVDGSNATSFRPDGHVFGKRSRDEGISGFDKDHFADVPRGVSVTRRVREYPQPRGGFLNPKTFDMIQLDTECPVLSEHENVHPGTVGIAVDYLTRFVTGSPASIAFDISRKGANVVGEQATFDELVESIRGLDEDSIVAGIKLAGFDAAYRAGSEAYRSVAEINPDDETVRNVQLMVKRGRDFLYQFGPKILDGLTFEGGYTDIVSAGDGDFLTSDTLWDFKVSKKEPTSKHTLQLLMYWRMGLHSIHPEYRRIENLGIFNPRLNRVYRLPVDRISSEVISEIERKVIGYD